MKTLLSLSGGGMKGYPQCAVLAELERRSGKPITKLFDLAAGTSVGGIALLSCCAGNSARDTLDFFTQDGPKIFRKSWVNNLSLMARGYRFGSKPIESALKRRFKSKVLADSPMNIVIPAVDRKTGYTVFFKSFDYDTARYGMWNVGRATSAAQTYFPAYKLNGWSLWDGGNSANNPAVCLLAQAVKLWGKEEEYRMLSIGCGEQPVHRCSRQPGIFATLAETVAMLFESDDSLPDYQLRQVMGDKFVQIQPIGISTGLADASPDALESLKSAANFTVQKFSREIDAFVN